MPPKAVSVGGKDLPGAASANAADAQTNPMRLMVGLRVGTEVPPLCAPRGPMSIMQNFIASTRHRMVNYDRKLGERFSAVEDFDES